MTAPQLNSDNGGQWGGAQSNTGGGANPAEASRDTHTHTHTPWKSQKTIMYL